MHIVRPPPPYLQKQSLLTLSPGDGTYYAPNDENYKSYEAIVYV
jgi:hypothetical protein